MVTIPLSFVFFSCEILHGFRKSFIPSLGIVKTVRMRKTVPPTIAHRDTLAVLVPLLKDAYLVFIQ